MKNARITQSKCEHWDKDSKRCHYEWGHECPKLITEENECITRLRACPFCGGKAKFNYSDGDRSHNEVKCTVCGVTGPPTNWYAVCDVIVTWNTRA